MTIPRFPYSRRDRSAEAAPSPALEFVAASVTYPGATRPSVRGVTLRVEAGSRVALVGPNGAGKSTVLRAAAGLLPASAGSVRVHGVPAGRCRERVAYLAQRGGVDWRFPMTVRRLVLTGRYVHLGWFARPGPADHRAVEDAMGVMGVGDLGDRRIGDLSGGQQQRVLLARALAQGADLLLLDEPLNAVDAGTRSAVRGVLRSLAASGATVLAATHDDPRDVGAEFDRVVRFDAGECDATAADGGAA